MEKSEILDNNSVKNISNFYLLFSNMKESKKLLNTYKKFINEYYETLNTFYKQLTEVNCHFLIEEKFKSSVIYSPIFQLGKSIKKAVSAQINNLFSIITNDKIFYAFNKSLSNLSDILQESSVKINTKKFGKNIRPIASSLIETYEVIESKVIDNYIRKKYNKHLEGLDDEKLETNIEQVKFLEKTFLDFEEESKIMFFNNLKEMELKTIKMFNEMKNNVENIIFALKNNKNDYLDILEKEISSIFEIGNKNENEIKYKEKNQKEEEFGLENSKEFLNFKYKIKIIYQPNIRVEDNIEIDFNDKNDIRNKTEAIIFDENKLTLTDEDIYNIVSTIYSYDLKMLNKSDYNLDKEKDKLKVKNLIEKLICFDSTKNLEEKITDEEVNILYDLLNNIDNLMKFFALFNNFRTKGKFQMTERAYNIIKNIFNKGQDYLLKNKERNLESLIIILSQTFYMMKDGKKIYLEKAIKDHDLFKKQEFWEDHLNTIINDEIYKFEEQQKELSIKSSKGFLNKKINEIVFIKIIPFINYLNEFEVSKEIISKIINPILNKYDLEENSKILIYSLLEKKQL